MADEINFDAVSQRIAQLKEENALLMTNRATQPQAEKSMLYPRLVQLADTASFGFADEAAAGLQSALKGWDYDAQLALHRDTLKQYQQENPGEALGIGLLGAVLPTLASGGRNLLGLGKQAAAIAPKAASPLVRVLQTPLGRGVTTGAGAGAAYGFGSSEGGLANRAIGAVEGGAIGGAAGGVVGLGGQMLKAQPMSHLIADEMGAIGSKRTPKDLKTALLLADTLVDQPADVLARGAAALKRASASGKPLFMPEAIGSQNLERLARRVANAPDSADLARHVLDKRAAGTFDRVQKTLGAISPEANQYAGARSLTKAADNIVQDAEGVVRAVGQQFADIGGDSVLFANAKVESVLAKPKVQQILTKLQKDWPDAWAPDEAPSFKNLTELKGKVWGLATKSARAGDSNEAHRLRGVYYEINDAIEDSLGEIKGPEYSDLRNLYSAAKGAVEKLTGNKRADSRKTVYGLLDGLVEQDPRKSIQAVNNMMKLPPEDISKIKSAFGTEYNAEFRKGVRAWAQETIENVKQRPSSFGATADDDVLRSVRDLGDLFLSPKIEKRLVAALGPNDAKDLISAMRLESAIFKGSSKYNIGSTTASNLEDAARFKKSSGAVSNLIKKANPINILNEIAGGIEEWYQKKLGPERAYRDLAGVLFDTERGAMMLDELGPLHAAMQKAAMQADDIAGYGGAMSGQARNIEISEKKKTKPGSGVNALMPIAGAAAIETGIDSDTNMAAPKLLDGIAQVESAGGKYRVGPKVPGQGTAKGTYQLMDKTGKWLHEKTGMAEPYDPNNDQQARKLAEHYIDEILLPRFGSLELALAGYNAGPTRVANAIKEAGTDDWDIVKEFLPKQTQEYPGKVLEWMEKNS